MAINLFLNAYAAELNVTTWEEEVDEELDFFEEEIDENADDDLALPAGELDEEDNDALVFEDLTDLLAVDYNEMGIIISIADNIITVRGLLEVMVGEVVTMPNGLLGQALNLNNDETTGIALS